MTASARLIDLLSFGTAAARPSDPTLIAKGAIYTYTDEPFITVQWNGSSWVVWSWGGRPVILLESTMTAVSDFETAHGVTVPAGAIVFKKS